jgi:hypothetical protein
MVLASQPVLLLLLKPELSVIQDFAYRRNGLGSDAIEIQTVVERKFIRGARSHFSQLLAIWADHQHFRIADVLVDGVVALIGATVVVRIEVRDSLFLL